MKNKKITRIIILLYIVLLFAYPYILGRNVSDINGSLPFFDKIVQNTNLIPFNFNYDINLDIIVKNIALKLLLFVPFGMIMKKEVTFKQGICALLLLSICKEILHLVTFAGYFDINDILLYIVGYLIGWYLKIGNSQKKLSFAYLYG